MSLPPLNVWMPQECWECELPLNPRIIAWYDSSGNDDVVGYCRSCYNMLTIPGWIQPRRFSERTDRLDKFEESSYYATDLPRSLYDMVLAGIHDRWSPASPASAMSVDLMTKLWWISEVNLIQEYSGSTSKDMVEGRKKMNQVRAGHNLPPLTEANDGVVL